MIINVAFVALVATLTAVEHLTLSKTWQRHELARWTMGVATVMFLSLLMVAVSEMSDFEVWLWMMAAFGAAGAVTSGLQTHEAALSEARRKEEVKREINETGQVD